MVIRAPSCGQHETRLPDTDRVGPQLTVSLAVMEALGSRSIPGSNKCGLRFLPSRQPFPAPSVWASPS